MRKELLLARSSVQRLRIAHEVDALRRSLHWPRAGLALAALPPVRSALFGLMVGLAGRSRTARLVRGAALAMLAVKLAAGLARKRGAATRPPASIGSPSGPSRIRE